MCFLNAPFAFTPFEILSHIAMREFHGRQIFIEDNRKIMAFTICFFLQRSIPGHREGKLLQLSFLAANLFPFCEVESKAIMLSTGSVDVLLFVSPTSQSGSFVRVKS